MADPEPTPEPTPTPTTPTGETAGGIATPPNGVQQSETVVNARKQ